MSNNGKPLEKTIQLIEETFKDSESTQIFPSASVPLVNINKSKSL